MAIAVRVLEAAAVLTLLGVFTRVALAVLAASLLYVFGAAQLSGAVIHDCHLVWFVVLLAIVTGREVDALGLGAWARGALLGRPSVASRRALQLARLWLGLVYFFPGVHKLTAGRAWLSGDILRGQLWFKWFEAGAAPWPRIDRVPALLAAGAIAVVLFELAMPLLVLVRRTRPIALLVGVAFHLLAGHFLDVLFPSLLVCYVVLLPSGAPRAASETSPSRAPLVAAVLTVPIFVLGALGRTQAWPFACYPTFADAPPDAISDLAVDAGGRSYRLPLLRRQDEWATVWRLAGLYDGRVDRAALRGFASLLLPEGASPPLSWFREEYDLAPERYGEPPIRRVLLLVDE